LGWPSRWGQQPQQHWSASRHWVLLNAEEVLDHRVGDGPIRVGIVNLQGATVSKLQDFGRLGVNAGALSPIEYGF
jgi:hypothetical protein